MTYRALLFKADQNLELCMDYCYNQTAVLAEYGCAGLAVTREEWMDNPHVYAIVIYNEMGEMVSGLRLHMSARSYPLQIESNVAGIEKIMYVMRSGHHKVTAELAGMWTAKNVRNEDFDQIMVSIATALSSNLGATSLFVLASHNNYKMYQDMGYMRVESVGRSGDFMNPSIDYSKVMMVPNVQTLEYAKAVQQAQMLSIRNQPVQTLLNSADKGIFIDCELDQLISAAPAVRLSYAFAA